MFYFQKLFGKPLALFKLKPLGYFSKKKGYKQLATNDDENDDENIEKSVQEMETEDVEETWKYVFSRTFLNKINTCTYLIRAFV